MMFARLRHAQPHGGWQLNASEEVEANIIAELKTARAFGSRTWGSPWFSKDGGNPLDFQERLGDTGYGTVMDMISAGPEVLEDGSTLDSGRWQTTGNAANVYDADYGKNVIQLTGTGIAPSANGWQIIDRDPEADLRNVLPLETIAQVKSFLLFNNPGRVTDVKLFPRRP